MAANTADKVRTLIAPIVEEMGLDLWDVRFLKEGASWYLRIFIDKEDGISIDDCSNVSHAVDPILDEADPIDESYYLEVCSPGLCRELLKPEHFEKMIGKEITVSLYKAVDGVKSLNGKLLEYGNDEVVLLVNDQPMTLQKSLISKASLNDSI